MRVPIPFVRAIFGVFLAAGIGHAANEKDIDAAIKRGTVYLKGQFTGGQPGGDSHGIGGTALAGLALLEAEVPPADPAIKAIAGQVRDNAYREVKTYNLALSVMFLDRLNEPADVPLIQTLAIRLLAGQNVNGGWGYPCLEVVGDADAQRLRAAFQNPGKPNGKLHPEVERYAAVVGANKFSSPGDDNSNTQFALLAVWVARRHGVPVEGALDLVEKRFLTGQSSSDGGWGYAGLLPGGATSGGSTPSMTCAGLLGLATGVARREEKRAKPEPKKDAPKDPKDPRADDPFFNPPPKQAEGGGGKKPGEKRPSDARDAGVQRALAGLGGYLAGLVRAGTLLNLNPQGHGDRDLYFLWSVERVGVIYSLDQIGGVDWYEVGSDVLVRSQGPDGAWTQGGSYGPTVNTALAILFLTKANVARDMSSKIKNDPTNNELRAGNPGAGNTSAIKSPSGTKSPNDPGPNPLPKPLSLDQPSAQRAAQLLTASGAEWARTLDELRMEKGTDNTKALLLAVVRLDGDQRRQVREALAERLTRMNAETLRAMMKHEEPELRRAATLACAMKDEKDHIPDLIDRLTDDEELVVRAARAGLKSMTEQDFGPANDSPKDQRKAAADAWRAWWIKQKK